MSSNSHPSYSVVYCFTFHFHFSTEIKAISLQCAVAIINIAIAFFGTVANGLVILVYHHNPRLRTIQDKVFFLLAVTDIIVNAFIEPAYVVATLMDFLGNSSCLLWSIIHVSSSFFLELSQALLFLLTLQSYITLAYPYHWRSIMTTFRFNTTIVITLILALALNVAFCFYDFTYKYIQPCFLLFEILVVIIIWCWIYKLVRRHQKAIKTTRTPSLKNEVSQAKVLRSTITLFVVILSLIVCHFLILTTLLFAPFLNRSSIGHDNFNILWSMAVTLMYLNSLINPCLVFWRSSSFRKTVKKYFSSN